MSQAASELQQHLANRGDSPFTLPPAFYTDEAFLSLEQQQLLATQWMCVGRENEIKNPGDYFTFDLLGEPLLVVRGDDQQVRVLANSCRHRGMPVASGQGEAKHFLCPYHAWRYGRDGELLSTPFMDKESCVPKDQCRLPAFRSEMWQGFIFVNLDGNAEPLATQLGELDALLANYHTDDMHHYFVREEVWDANWKCLLENFMEGYHLSVVHPQTLGGRTPTRLSRKVGGNQAFTAYKAHYPDTAPERGQGSPDLSEEEQRCSTLFSVFPALVASQSPDILVYLTLQPEGVDKVRLRWSMSCYEADLCPDILDQRLTLWQQINAEDKHKLQALQRALGSRHAPAGPLAGEDYEGTIKDFHRHLTHHLGRTA